MLISQAVLGRGDYGEPYQWVMCVISGVTD